jgi:hypothetical protein
VSRLTTIAVAACALALAGPSLVQLAHALVPLLMIVGVFAVVWRLCSYLTGRY